MLIPRDHWQYGWADLFTALAADLRQGADDADIELPTVGHCVPVQSGRAGLVAVLRGLDLPHEARVGVPLFCCPVVFQAIRAAGCRPVFLDVDPATCCLCPQDLAGKAGRLDAVLAVHMFGNVCDVPTIRQLADPRPVIEDCAQALGSRLGTRPTGTLGTVAFFSFRSGKYLSAGWGGALFTADAALRERLWAAVSSQSRPSRIAAARHTLAQFLKSLLRSRPAYGWLGHRLWAAARGPDFNPTASVMQPGRIFPGDLAVARRRVLDLPAAIQKQRAHAEYLERHLKLPNTAFCQERAGTTSNRYLFPVKLASTEERDSLADGLRSRGVDTMRYLDEVVSVAREHYGYTGDCPESERLSRTVLVLPAYHALSEADLRHIVTATNRVWEQMHPNRSATKSPVTSPVADATVS